MSTVQASKLNVQKSQKTKTSDLLQLENSSLCLVLCRLALNRKFIYEFFSSWSAIVKENKL